MTNSVVEQSTLLSHPKVGSFASFASLLDEKKTHGKRIVFTNGCYDIVHPGHVDLLARARALGDVLILGLNTDASVRRQNKGEDRPINTLAVRSFVLAHLASVNFVIPFDEDTPLALIKQIQPHVLVKGGDWKKEAIVGADIVEANGGEVHSLALLEGFSTTALIKQIRSGQSALNRFI